jgi:hypothetical protein
MDFGLLHPKTHNFDPQGEMTWIGATKQFAATKTQNCSSQSATLVQHLLRSHPQRLFATVAQ